MSGSTNRGFDRSRSAPASKINPPADDDDPLWVAQRLALCESYMDNLRSHLAEVSSSRTNESRIPEAELVKKAAVSGLSPVQETNVATPNSEQAKSSHARTPPQRNLHVNGVRSGRRASESAATAALERDLLQLRRTLAAANVETQGKDPNVDGVMSAPESGRVKDQSDEHRRVAEESSTKLRPRRRHSTGGFMSDNHSLQRREDTSQSVENKHREVQDRVNVKSTQDLHAVSEHAPTKGDDSSAIETARQQYRTLLSEVQFQQKERLREMRENRQRAIAEETRQKQEHARTEEEVAMWKTKAEASLRGYRTLLSQAQAAQRDRMKQAIQLTALTRDKDRLLKENSSLRKEKQGLEEEARSLRGRLEALLAVPAPTHELALGTADAPAGRTHLANPTSSATSAMEKSARPLSVNPLHTPASAPPPYSSAALYPSPGVRGDIQGNFGGAAGSSPGVGRLATQVLSAGMSPRVSGTPRRLSSEWIREWQGKLRRRPGGMARTTTA